MQTRRKLLTPFLTGDRSAEDAVQATRPAPAVGASGGVFAPGAVRLASTATSPSSTPASSASLAASRLPAGNRLDRSL